MGVKGLPLLFRVPQRSRKNSEDPSCSPGSPGSGHSSTRHFGGGGAAAAGSGAVGGGSGGGSSGPLLSADDVAWKIMPNSALRSFGSSNRLQKSAAPGAACGHKEFVAYIVKRLTAGNPHEPDNTVAFNYRSGEWVVLTRRRICGTIQLFEDPSRVIVKDSAEGIALLNKLQMTRGYLGLLSGRPDSSRKKIATARRNVMTATKAAVQLRKEEIKCKDSSTEKHASSDSDSDTGAYMGIDKSKPCKPRGGPQGMSANKFNYYERGTQTGWASVKEKGTMTDPPSLRKMQGMFCQWLAYDDYQRHGLVSKTATHFQSLVEQTSGTLGDGDELQSQPTAMSRSNSCAEVPSSPQQLHDPNHAEETPPGVKTPFSRPGTPLSLLAKHHGAHAPVETSPRPYDYCRRRWNYQASEKALLSIFTQQKGAHLYQDLSSRAPAYDLSSLARSARIIERMISQNIDDSIQIDFKYWEDAADEFRDLEGTLLPLWNFSTLSNNNKRERLAVTGIAWSRTYPDLFAASFGSYDFCDQPIRGLLCLFSLKNTETPEYEFETSCGVMCVAVHPRYSHLVAIGCYDGSVEVYNLKAANGRGDLVWQSVAYEDGHVDVVWSISWINDDQDGRPLLLSLSADGYLVQWTVHQSSREIKRHDIVYLKMDPPVVLSDKSLFYTHACGTALAFHPRKTTDFVVGTEEGHIYFGSTAYHSKISKKFASHNMAVYGLSWNYFSDFIFVSAGADWTIRIWDSRRLNPLLEIDIGCEVEDVSWAPYSSTVLAVVTGDGEVQVFDLAEDRFAPICVQKVTRRRRSKCTRIAFNPVHPVVIVGDNRGNLTSLKLSPNLRKKPKQAKNSTCDERLVELEEKKLSTLLALL